jgi:hypothetical protein
LKDDRDLELCIEQIKTDYDRYYFSVFVTIGIRDFVNKNKTLFLKFVSSERKMKIVGNKENVGAPDIILQYNHIDEGILIEFKSSSPLNSSLFIYSIDEDCKQIEKYDNKLIGWDTKSETIGNHSIVLLVHHENYKKVRNEIIEKRMKKGKLALIHKFSIWEWTPELSMKYGKGEQIVIRDNDNGIIGNELGEYLQDNDIILPIQEIEDQYGDDQLKFIRKEPPISYLIDVILFVLLPKLFSETEMTVSLDEIMELAEIYLPSWVPDCSQKSQLRRWWVKKCMNTLKEIGIVKIIKNDEYTIKIPKNKDLSIYIKRKLAKIELEKRKNNFRKRKIEETDLDATILDEY